MDSGTAGDRTHKRSSAGLEKMMLGVKAAAVAAANPIATSDTKSSKTVGELSRSRSSLNFSLELVRDSERWCCMFVHQLTTSSAYRRDWPGLNT